VSTPQRLTFLLIAVLLAVGAFVLLGGDDDIEPSGQTPVSGTPTPAGEEQGATAGGTSKPTPARTPPPPLLTAGSERTIRVEQGEQVRFRVRHPTAEEVHVHGYDVIRELEPGRTVTVSFPADIAGIFEVELEASHQPLGTVEVRP
jgi:hypothetical protein